MRTIVGSVWTRALVSAGLLVAVASQIDFRTGAKRLSQGEWEWFALAVAVLVAAFVVGAKRWHVYLRAAGTKVRFADVLRAYLIGVFVTNFLPSEIGGDAARAWVVGGPGTRVRAATTVVVDRVVALGCLLVVAWIGLAANPATVPASLIAALAVVTGGFAAFAMGAVVLLHRSGSLAHWLPGRARGFAREARNAARSCVTASVLREASAYSFAFQALAVLSAWLIAVSISLGVSFSTLVVTLPLALVVGVLPISIGGLGVREGVFIVLLGQAGVSATAATIFSLLSGIAFALASLSGAVVLLRRGRPAATVTS